jgi:hypothetical protein
MWDGVLRVLRILSELRALGVLRAILVVEVNWA